MANQQPHDPFSADYSTSGTGRPSACGAQDLRSLLSTIVEQLSDADRRHSETLHQMQDRLAGIGREAQSLRERVPEHLSETFQRIESGMSELTQRFAESGQVAQRHIDAPIAQAKHDDEIAPPPRVAESPVALKSAAESLGQSPRPRDQDSARRTAAVDTFDVIESSIPGNVTDPWDNDAAEALSGIYDNGSGSYSSQGTESATSRGGLAFQSSPYALPASGSQGGIDYVWLETRLNEIANRIDQSLSDIRPHDGFFALGQRFDGFEQQLARLSESAASKNDVEHIREIESHVGEVAGHLERTYDQLVRLTAIEEQLAAVSAKLDDMHRMVKDDVQGNAGAHGVSMGGPQSAAAGGEQLRPLIEQMITEQRQGEENTAALLDVLQQAMIRLLDRVDAMELAQHQAAGPSHREPAAPSVPFDLGPATHVPEVVPDYEPKLEIPNLPSLSAEPLDHRPPPSAMPAANMPPAAERDGAVDPRAGGKSRQDFISEARRARMRLTGEEDGSAMPSLSAVVVPPIPDASKDSAKPAPKASKNATPGGATFAGSKTSGPTAPSARLVLLAVILTIVLGGLWFTTEDQGPVLLQTTKPAVTTPEAGAPRASTELGAPPPSPGLKLSPADAKTGSAAPAKGAPSDGTGTRGDLERPLGTDGHIVPGELTVGATSVPLLGVAVDTERPVTSDDMKKTTRQQAMAHLSGKLGTAAAESAAGMVTPAALVPGGEIAGNNIQQGQPTAGRSVAGTSTPLDLPPATVGPYSLRIAAANGDPSAEFEVGARLAEGKGTAQTYAEAAKWYQRSAARGFAPAQYRLGTLYERGLGLKADSARAQDWYARAAEQGNIKAMHNLAVLSANQTKGSPDYATAARWFSAAAEHGLADSQFNLAVLYENGLGVEQDLKSAFKWISLAARSGDAEAVRRRDILRGKLTAEEIAAADGMIKSWIARPVDSAANDARAAGEAWKRSPERNG